MCPRKPNLEPQGRARQIGAGDPAALLRQVAQQDPAALRALYELTSPRLLGVIRRIVPNEADSCDVLQDVYIRVWHSARQYSGAGSAWGWLIVMARHLAMDRRKQCQRRHEVPLPELDALWAESSSDDGVWAHSIQQCLERLRGEPRNAILLSYVYGYSHGELALHLGRPLGTVKAWLRRSLTELKLCLES
ncbi:sigma-70 family RNA polymerase sigma factor [Natronospirillum operosum]|uniref:Sigma-70 family RNA polymerase sigma factor n=1 Tax=Natronospirillum operosum TaxID=2759953 RepID=A0A4Z0WFQ1_9GAMM|nr:sigma-70 family RNA polymerase sigma factor [Natronospirillum operosum]TGG93320.1 sigma-70 family RNA polymerase sigma factor [Natronospirillum operosum]